MPRDKQSAPVSLDYASPTPGRSNAWLISAGILAGLLTLALVRQRLSPAAPTTPAPLGSQSSPAPSPPPAAPAVDLRGRWDSKIQPRIASADQACRDSIDPAVRVLTDFIAERRAGARPFAESVLGFRSKWNLVVSHCPGWLGGDDDAHRAYLEAQFNEHLFSGHDMQQAVEAAVRAYLDQVQSVENQLLVDVRADLADWPAEAAPALRSEILFRQQYESLLARVAPQVAGDFEWDVARELGSWIGAELAARVALRVLGTVAARLGVSGGILGAGAGASWGTFGLSMVAAVAIDQVLGAVIDWATDPVGKIETRVNEMLDELGALVVNGEDGAPGLRAELLRLDGARGRLRAAALRELVLGPEGATRS